MVARVLGIPAWPVRTVVADTTSIGFTYVTGGSRVTFATGMAATQVAEQVVEKLEARREIWDIPVDAVEWRDGKAFPAGSNAGEFNPLDLGAIARKAARSGGANQCGVSLNAEGAAPRFGAHLCDVSVDNEDRALHGISGSSTTAALLHRGWPCHRDRDVRRSLRSSVGSPFRNSL
jgi:CO/xanthine dehydrogenase Mo-binding subunit